MHAAGSVNEIFVQNGYFGQHNVRNVSGLSVRPLDRLLIGSLSLLSLSQLLCSPTAPSMGFFTTIPVFKAVLQVIYQTTVSIGYSSTRFLVKKQQP